jgi:hypothetical protein
LILVVASRLVRCLRCMAASPSSATRLLLLPADAIPPPPTLPASPEPAGASACDPEKLPSPASPHAAHAAGQSRGPSPPGASTGTRPGGAWVVPAEAEHEWRGADGSALYAHGATRRPSAVGSLRPRAESRYMGG